MTPNFRKVMRAASILQAKRTAAFEAEIDLLHEVQVYLDGFYGSARQIARSMGYSAAYICDVRHGRRKISQQFVERLERLK